MSVPVSGGYYAAPPEVSFDWLGKGWDLFKAKAGMWVGALVIFILADAAIFGVVGLLTGYWAQFGEIFRAASRSGGPPTPPTNPFAHFGSDLLTGILAGAFQSVLQGGLLLMALKQARGENVSINDMFSAFRLALPLLVSGFFVSLLSGLGMYLCIVPGVLLYGLWMFTPLFIVDRQMGPFQAMSASWNLLKSNWLMAGAFVFVVYLLLLVSAIPLGLGLLVSIPTVLLSIAVGYLAFTQPAQAVIPNYGQAAPGVWPPPPTATQQTPGVFAQPSAPPPAAEMPSIADPPPPAAPANPFGQPANPAANPFGSPPASSQNPFGQTPPRTSLSGEPLDENGQVIAPPPANPPRPPESQ